MKDMYTVINRQTAPGARCIMCMISSAMSGATPASAWLGPTSKSKNDQTCNNTPHRTWCALYHVHDQFSDM
jgi:hypothetical protein